MKYSLKTIKLILMSSIIALLTMSFAVSCPQNYTSVNITIINDSSSSESINFSISQSSNVTGFTPSAPTSANITAGSTVTFSGCLATDSDNPWSPSYNQSMAANCSIISESGVSAGNAGQAMCNTIFSYMNFAKYSRYLSGAINITFTDGKFNIVAEPGNNN